MTSILIAYQPPVDRMVTTFPDTRHYETNYSQPIEIVRSETDPILSKMNSPVVVKTSWPEITRRGNEAAMYRASGGRFGTIPHLCSYEAVGEHREVISNIQFLPRDWDVADYHWPILSDDLPERPELRTLWVSVFPVERRPPTDATSPRQLSRAWVHFLLGAPTSAP